MTAARGSVRRQVRIRRPADDVWAIVGQPGRIQEWFPGIVDSTWDPDTRTRVITTGSGLPMPEQVVTLDPVLRRLQYRITAPMIREHLSTLDVLDLGDGSCLALYSVDAEPSVMALVIGGAAGSALEHLRRDLEGAQ